MNKVITIDCDDVLSETAMSFLKYYNHTIYGVSLKRDDLHTYITSENKKLKHIPALKETGQQIWHDFFMNIRHKDFPPIS